MSGIDYSFRKFTAVPGQWFKCYSTCFFGQKLIKQWMPMKAASLYSDYGWLDIHPSLVVPTLLILLTMLEPEADVANEPARGDNFHTLLHKEVRVFTTNLLEVETVVQWYITRFLYVCFEALSAHSWQMPHTAVHVYCQEYHHESRWYHLFHQGLWVCHVIAKDI